MDLIISVALTSMTTESDGFIQKSGGLLCKIFTIYTNLNEDKKLQIIKYLWSNNATRTFFRVVRLEFCVQFSHTLVLQAGGAHADERQEFRWIFPILCRCLGHTHEETPDFDALAVVTAEYYQIHVADEIVRVLKIILLIIITSYFVNKIKSTCLCFDLVATTSFPHVWLVSDVVLLNDNSLVVVVQTLVKNVQQLDPEKYLYIN